LDESDDSINALVMSDGALSPYSYKSYCNC